MSIFEKAKAASVPGPVPKGKKSEARELDMKGMETYASLIAVGDQIDTLAKSIGAKIKANMAIEFIKTGMKGGRTPENFKGVEGVAKGSCELRRRASNRPLSADEIALLNQHDIPTVEDDVVVETYIINPAYAADEDMLLKISKALEGVPGLPEDFILHQSQKKTTVTAESVNAVFALKDAKVIASLIPLVATLALKPVMSDLDRAFELVGKLIFEDEDEDESDGK